MGAFGEGSEDLHSLLQIMGESRLRAQGLARGMEGSAEELGVIVGQIRRKMSTASIRAIGNCLLSRLRMLGEGSKNAAKRRQWAMREDQRMTNERRAVWLAQVAGRGLVRRGQFLIP